MPKFVYPRTAIFLIVISFAFNSCFDLPDELILPQWQVDLNIPLLNTTYTLNEIINSNPYIGVDSSDDDVIYIFQSDVFGHNSGIADFVTLSFETSIQNVPIPASDTDSIPVYIEYPEGIEIDSAVFNDGTISISIFNPSNHRANVDIRFPGIFNPAGAVLVIHMTVDPFTGDSVQHNLINHTYKFPEEQPIGTKNSLQIIAKVTSSVPQETFVLSSIYISDFYFKSVNGLLPPKSLGYDEDVFTFDIDGNENYRDRIRLSQAKLNLSIGYISPNSAPVDVEARNLNIVGMRNDGEEFYLRDSTGSIFHRINLVGASTEKIYTEQNSNVHEFISFLPDSIIIRAEYVLNPDHKRVAATYEDTIKIEADFSTKSFVSMHNAYINDITSIEIGNKDRNIISDWRNADIMIEFDNAIPVGMWFTLHLKDVDGNFLFTLTKNTSGLDSVYFEPADVDEFGNVISSTPNEPIRIVLDSAQVEMLSRSYSADFSVLVSTKNSGTVDPIFVAVRPSAWLKIKAYCKARYDVGNKN